MNCEMFFNLLIFIVLEIHITNYIFHVRASKWGPGGPLGVHSASSLGPPIYADLHMHNECINNKCVYMRQVNVKC